MDIDSDIDAELAWRAEHDDDGRFAPPPPDEADDVDPEVAVAALYASGEAHTVAVNAVEALTVRGRVLVADQYHAISTVLTDAAACPDPWVGPDPTRDPAWHDPQHRPVSAVRAERCEIAVRAAALDLGIRLGLSEHMIRNRATYADTLRTRCPHLWAAFRAGRVSEQNAVTAAQQAGSLPADDPDAWARFDDTLTTPAQTLTPGKFRLRARVVRERVHPQHIDDRHQNAAADRTTWLNADPDGMATYTIFGPATDLHTIDRRVDAHARHLRTQPDETRTLAQLRADTAIDILRDGHTRHSHTPDTDTPDSDTRDGDTRDSDTRDGDMRDGDTRDRDTPDGDTRDRDTRDGDTRDGQARDGRTTAPAVPGPARGRVSVAITVPVMTLLGHDDEPATLHGYGPIDTDTARRLAGQATSWVRILTHPVTGTVLDVDRTTYRVPEPLRRWLGVRDPVCTMPGCTRLAHDCDIDHRLDWQYGGTTTDTNLAPLCEPHHVIKTKSNFTLHRDDDTGERWWTTPTGHNTPLEPPPF